MVTLGLVRSLCQLTRDALPRVLSFAKLKATLCLENRSDLGCLPLAHKQIVITLVIAETDLFISEVH